MRIDTSKTPAHRVVIEHLRYTNNDGQLTREEYPQKEVFDAVDANQDGHATLEEVRTYYRSKRSAK